MTYKRKRRSVLARWDPEVLDSMRELLPDSNDRERSQMLFKGSLFGAEKYLRDVDKKYQERTNKKRKGKRGIDEII